MKIQAHNWNIEVTEDYVKVNNEVVKVSKAEQIKIIADLHNEQAAQEDKDTCSCQIPACVDPFDEFYRNICVKCSNFIT